MELKVNDPKLIEAIFNGDAPDIYFAPDVDTLIAEKDALIAELKQKLENVQASMYCDVVDANMKSRKIHRAFYKACANWAKVSVAFHSSYATKDKWRKMEHKCRAKAEEYK